MSAAGLVLGLVYVMAGVGKAFVLEQLSQTIVEITRISSPSATYLALALVSSEVIGGMCLLTKRTARWAALFLLLLTSVFIWVLLSAILKGRPIECNCFGILNIDFPNHIELTIDFVFFNALGILALGHRAGQNRRHEVGGRTRIRWWYVVTGVVIFYIEAEMLLVAYSRVDGQLEGNTLAPVVQYARQRDASIDGLQGRSYLLFLLDFSDFTCPPCFSDFMALSDSITRLHDGPLRTPAIGLMRPGLAFGSRDQERLDEWAHASDLRFKVFIAPDSLFVQTGFRRSCAILVGPAGCVSERAEFPLGAEMRNKILEALR
jgi:uncharacterized membrane protein YphA (DoxX/SURF4 family)